MAQYFQVLSQGDKLTSEDLGRFCSNIVENQATVQYVIRPTDQSFQQGQQILLSSDQLMLVDGQPQQIIVDQSQVALSNPQYVLQDANIEFQDARTQQIFYMDNSNNVARVETMVEEPVAQPVVLNHHLHTTPILTNIVGSPIKTMPIQRPMQHNQNLGQNSTVLVNQRQMSPQVRASLGQTVRSPMVPQARPSLVPQARPSLVPQARPCLIQQTRSPLTPQQRHVQPNQGQPQTSVPRLVNPNVKNKTPNLQYNTPNQESSFKQQREKKPTSTVLNQMKQTDSQVQVPQGPKRKVSKTPTSRTRTPKAAKGGGSANFETGIAPQPRVGTPRPPRPTLLLQRPSLAQHGTLPRPSAPMVPVQQQQQQQPVIQSPQVIHQPQPQPQMMQQPPPIQQQHQQLEPAHNPNYVIQPQSMLNQAPQQQVLLPPLVHSNQIKQIIESTPVGDEYADSIRMLVVLSNGEQRLITFTLPKEPCTIQEILEQVGVTIKHDTIIKCSETRSSDINYFVHVMYPSDPPINNTESNNATEEMSSQEEVAAKSPDRPASPPSAPEPPPKLPSPEPPKELPKLIPGKLAVCNNCGYVSEDFNRCLRCKRRLPEDVKSINVGEQAMTKKADVGKGAQTGSEKVAKGAANGSANNTPKNSQSPARKRPSRAKVVEQEPIILTLSSDEEEDETDAQVTASLKFIESQAANSDNKKEPTMQEIQQWETKGETKDEVTPPQLTTSIHCRTIRIGSYRFVPADNTIIVGTNEFVLKVPLPSNPKEYRTITVATPKIVRVLANFQKILPVIFIYVSSSAGNEIRSALGMEKGTEYYFDPMAREEAYKRITVLPEFLGEEAKHLFKQMYGPRSILEELNAKEANSILLKTCPKEVSKSVSMASSGYTDIKQLLIYPPGKGGLSINTEDYLCLAQDQFLNDVIIDFYIKYLALQLPQEQQEKVHVFSTFFYKRLTTKPATKASRRTQPSEIDSTLTAAQKRHARVKNWTKNVNLFEKDFIIVPINESCHWFLAIICFPGMDGCYTSEGKPCELEPLQKKNVKKKPLSAISITQLKSEKLDNLLCDPDDSDKDEAEGDDSEFESEEDTEEPKPTVAPAIKQPCVLIFDSLAGASRSRVVATLRDYLTCEYKIKMNSEKLFNKDIMKYGCPKVPQQTNFTDCGLYLLQYVESFFKTPIKSYQLPMHELKTWFDELTATKKREDIAKLIKDLMIKYHKDIDLLPEIQLPTLNGKLIANEEEMEEEEEDEDDKTSEASTVYMLSRTSETGESNSPKSIVKPSSSMEMSQSFDEDIVNAIKPDTSEVKKQSNRETLSYLKAKRIVRHKTSEGSDSKKFKPNDVA